MKTTFLLITLLLLNVETKKKCPERSFTRLNVVTVDRQGQKKTETINQCISPNTLLYNEQSLHYIRVSNQTISALKKGFVNDISTTFILQVTYNSIDSIKEEAFLNLPQIREIELSHNGIQWIESNAFTDMLLLEAVDLSYNKFEQLLQNVFNNLPNLEIIDLGNNNLKFFHQDWFYKTYILEMLILNDNQISSLSRGAFTSLPNLKTIELSNNHIVYIHKYAFQDLKLLSELMLKGNWLKKMEVDFSINPQLKVLSVRNNNITYLSDSFLNGIEESVNVFFIQNNPWQCGCFEKITKWGVRTNIEVSWKCNESELHCVIPKKKVNECIERSDNDFHNHSFQAFQKECT